MTAILGIDAAWTAAQPSGVALISNAGGTWRCVALAPSYAMFTALADGIAVDWSATIVGAYSDGPGGAFRSHAGARSDVTRIGA